MALIQQIYCKENNTCFSIPLEKRKVIKKTIARSLWSLIVILWFFIIFLSIPFTSFFGLSLTMFGLGLFIVILVIFFGLLAPYIFQCFYYRYYFYDLTQDDVIIKKGVISRKEITLPYSKIQNIYVDQDVLDRIFKLYDVHLETAGFSSGMAAHIDGVSEANMNKLRDMLIAKTKKSSGSGV